MSYSNMFRVETKSEIYTHHPGSGEPNQEPCLKCKISLSCLAVFQNRLGYNVRILPQQQQQS